MCVPPISSAKYVTKGPPLYYVLKDIGVGGPEKGNFSFLYVVKIPYVGGWVVQKSLKTPLRNIKMSPN